MPASPHNTMCKNSLSLWLAAATLRVVSAQTCNTTNIDTSLVDLTIPFPSSLTLALQPSLVNSNQALVPIERAKRASCDENETVKTTKSEATSIIATLHRFAPRWSLLSGRSSLVAQRAVIIASLLGWLTLFNFSLHRRYLSGDYRLAWESGGCKRVSVSGCKNTSPDLMTDYELQNAQCEGRSVYLNSNGYYLYFWDDEGYAEWMIGDCGCGSDWILVFGGDNSEAEPFHDRADGWHCYDYVIYDFEAFDLSLVCEEVAEGWTLTNAVNVELQYAYGGTGNDPMADL